MTAREHLRALVDASPADAVVSVPVRWLSALLDDGSGPGVAPDAKGNGFGASGVDLTVAQVAARFGKGLSTVRTWLAAGELPDAYRLHGREWRIPLSAVEAMQRRQAAEHKARARRAVPAPSNEPTDIRAWREHLPRAS